MRSADTPEVVSLDLTDVGASDVWVVVQERLRALTGDVRVCVVRVPTGSDAATMPPDLLSRARALERLAAADTLFVAVLTGRCTGAGLALALGCDLRVAGEGATLSFAGPEVFGVLARLSRLVGHGRALELALTGRRMSAGEAGLVGLANLVVGGGQVADAVGDLTAALLATPREHSTELKRALLTPASDKKSHAEELAALVRLTREDGSHRER